MTRAEEWLLSRMTVRRWLLSVVVVGVGGFFGGREYLAWQMRSALRDIGNGFANIGNGFADIGKALAAPAPTLPVAASTPKVRVPADRLAEYKNSLKILVKANVFNDQFGKKPGGVVAIVQPAFSRLTRQEKTDAARIALFANADGEVDPATFAVELRRADGSLVGSYSPSNGLLVAER